MTAVHLAFLAFSVAMIIFADKQAFAWFSGKRTVLSHRTLRMAHYGVWAGLLGMIASGVYMAYPIRAFLFGDPTFLMKMLFVGVLITNGLLIDSLMKVAAERPYSSLAVRERVPLFISGGVSLIAWAGTMTLGFFLF